MEKEWKKLLFCSYVRHISLWFYSNCERERSLDVEFNLVSNEYPHCIIFTDLTTSKIRNTWKNVMMMSSSRFLGISCFWSSRVYQKYVAWVIVGCVIKFHIQWALPLEIWVKPQGDMSKIWTKKSSFFHSSSKINNYYFIIFLRMPILDLKFPLMIEQLQGFETHEERCMYAYWLSDEPMSSRVFIPLVERDMCWSVTHVGITVAVSFKQSYITSIGWVVSMILGVVLVTLSFLH